MSLVQSEAQVKCVAPYDLLFLTITVTKTHIVYLWNYNHYEEEVVACLLM